jgi:hypothetical protein
MAQKTISGGGAFTRQNIGDVNANFTELYATTAGGALTSAHILVGNGSNVAASVAVSGDATLANTGALTVASVNGVKFASGVTALDGSNPTTIATGLTTITGIGLALNRSTSLASGTAFVTYNNISGGSFDVYGWVVAGTASTGTENVAWTVTGT